MVFFRIWSSYAARTGISHSEEHLGVLPIAFTPKRARHGEAERETVVVVRPDFAIPPLTTSSSVRSVLREFRRERAKAEVENVRAHLMVLESHNRPPGYPGEC